LSSKGRIELRDEKTEKMHQFVSLFILGPDASGLDGEEGVLVEDWGCELEESPVDTK
jgi:hypothetical protein